MNKKDARFLKSIVATTNFRNNKKKIGYNNTDLKNKIQMFLIHT
jgi:hypothetical protein